MKAKKAQAIRGRVLLPSTHKKTDSITMNQSNSGKDLTPNNIILDKDPMSNVMSP